MTPWSPGDPDCPAASRRRRQLGDDSGGAALFLLSALTEQKWQRLLSQQRPERSHALEQQRRIKTWGQQKKPSAIPTKASVGNK